MDYESGLALKSIPWTEEVSFKRCLGPHTGLINLYFRCSLKC